MLPGAVGCHQAVSGLNPPRDADLGDSDPDDASDAGTAFDATLPALDAGPVSTVRITAPETLLVEEGATGAIAAIIAEGSLGGAVAVRLDPGTDAVSFDLDETTGSLTLHTPLDFEAPADANQDNVYELIFTAEDDLGTTATATLEVHVLDRRAFEVVFPPQDSIIEGLEETVVTVRRVDEDATAPIFVQGIVTEQRSEPFSLWAATVPVDLGRNTLRATMEEAGPLGLESAEVTFDNIPQDIWTLPVPEAGGALLLPTGDPPWHAYWLDLASHRITQLSESVRDRLSGFQLRGSYFLAAHSYRAAALDASQDHLWVLSEVREGSSLVGLRVDRIDPRQQTETRILETPEAPFDLEQVCEWMVVRSLGPAQVAILCHDSGESWPVHPPSESWLAIADVTSGEVAWRAVPALAMDVEPSSTMLRLWDGETLRALDLQSGELSTLSDFENPEWCIWDEPPCDARHVDLRTGALFSRRLHGLTWSVVPIDAERWTGPRASFHPEWGLPYATRPLSALDRQTGKYWVASTRQIISVDLATATLELLWGGAGSGVPAHRLGHSWYDREGERLLALQRNQLDNNTRRLVAIDLRTGRRTMMVGPLRVEDIDRTWTIYDVWAFEYDSARRAAFIVGAPIHRGPSLLMLSIDTGETTVLAPGFHSFTLWLDDTSNALISCEKGDVTSFDLVSGSTQTVASLPDPIRCDEILGLEPTRRELVLNGRVQWKMDDGGRDYGFSVPVLVAIDLDSTEEPTVLFGTNAPHIGDYGYHLYGPEVTGGLGILGPGRWDGYEFQYALVGPIEGEPGALMVIDREAEELQRFQLATRALEPIMEWPRQELSDLFECGTVSLDTDLCIAASNPFDSENGISIRDLPSRQRAIIAR